MQLKHWIALSFLLIGLILGFTSGQVYEKMVNPLTECDYCLNFKPNQVVVIDQNTENTKAFNECLKRIQTYTGNP